MDLTQAILLAQQGGAPKGHPLQNMFTGAPMYGNSNILPTQIFDLSGIPGLGPNTQMGFVANIFLQSFLPQILGPKFTAGQFSPNQNIFDHIFNRQNFLQRRQAISRSAEADVDTYFKLITGMGRMAGVEYEPGSEQEKAARRFAQDISSWGPILGDMMPEMFDQMHGRRGSSQMMARNMYDVTRFVRDPITGQIGMSQQTAATLSRDVFTQLYGPAADITLMKGLGAGRAGQIYDEMVKRGFAPTNSPEQLEKQLTKELSKRVADIDSIEVQKLRRDIGKKLGVGADEAVEDLNKIAESLQDLAKTDPSALDAALRSFNASKVAKSIENMAGAVAAMRDIFGDMGRPNAPMIELINGLQAMTQGGLAYMTPQQLEASVRQTYNISKMTGLGFEGIMGFAGTASQILEQQGMSRGLSVPIAQGSAAFGYAFGQVRQAQQFGAMDREMASQIDIRLRAQAASSPQAARLGGFMRLADELVREDGSVGFGEQTEAAALASAIRRYNDTGITEYSYTDPKTKQTVTKSIFQSAESLRKIIIDSGGSATDANNIIYNTNADSVSKQINKYNIINAVREGQGILDVRTNYVTKFGNFAATSLNEMKNITKGQKAKLSQPLGAAIFDVTNKLFEESPELFDDGREVERNKAIAAEVRKVMGNQLNNVNISDAELANIVSTSIQRAEEYARTPGSGMSGMGGFFNSLRPHQRRIFNIQKRTQAESRAISNLQSTLAGLGQEGIVSRISDFIMEADKDSSVEEFISRALGGVANKEIAVPLQALIERLVTLQQQADDTKITFADSPDLMKAEQQRTFDEMARLLPAVSGLLEGNTDALTPEAQEIVKKFKESRSKTDQKPKDVDPKLIKLETAREAYKKARDAALLQDDSVKVAKSDRDATAKELDKVRKQIAEAKDTNEFKQAKENLDSLTTRHKQLVKDIKNENDPKKFAEKKQELQRVEKQMSEAQKEVAKQSKATESLDEVINLRKQEDILKNQLSEKQSILQKTIDKVAPKVDEREDIKKLKEDFEKAKNETKNETKNNEEAKKEVDSKKSDAQPASISSQAFTFPNIPKLDLNIKDLKISTQSVILAAADKEGNLPDPISGAGKPQKITGTLTIIGLNQGKLDGTGVPVDPRAPGS